MKNTEDYLKENFDFNEIEDTIKGNIDACLSDRESYLQFFTDYIEFNYIFAGCVSALAGRFHISPSVDNSAALKNVSHLVAKNVFEAAIDEYQGITHKEMSFILLKEMNNFFNKKKDPSDNIKGLLKDVKFGYGILSNCKIDVLAVNLGFHIASEQLASFEFSYLDEKVKRDYKELYDKMNEKQNNLMRPWTWVEIHGKVEEDHANYAYKASDLILNKLKGKEVDSFLSNIHTGFNFFIEVQSKFFHQKSLMLKV